MNRLNISSWSINVKIFILVLGSFLAFNIINTPLSIEAFSEVNRQAFRQVVTESALRQKAAIDEDFEVALEIFEAFQSANISYLSVQQWLTRSDPSTEGFNVNARQTKAAAERAVTTEILNVAPAIFRQAWLIDAEGRIVSDITTNFAEPRFNVELGDYVDAVDSPAHRAGQLLGEANNVERQTDLVIEQVDGTFSIQLITAILGTGNEFAGTLVVELNNETIILNNIQLSGINNETYSFVASPENGDAVIKLDSTNPSLINLDTQATRSSVDLFEAQSYVSGDHRVIGFYTPLFQAFRNDVIFIVELDERVVLSDVLTSIFTASGPTLILQIFLLLIVIAIINWLFVRPIRTMTDMIRSMVAGDFRSSFRLNTGDDEIGTLAESVNELRTQLEHLNEDMNTRLESRSRDLQITQEIGQVAISEIDLNQLMTQVVNLIAERFEQIYHAQIFLIEGDYAVLKASTGEAGQQLLRNGHRLGVGSLSVIGQVTQQNQTIIARDTAVSDVHRRNEFLQDTRAELAIPMRLGTLVIGALDVQSTYSDAFDEDLVAILETMTYQIAIAIENSRLYEASQRRLREFENTSQLHTQRNWEDFMYSQRTQQMMSHAGAQAVYDFSQLREKATNTQKVAVGDITDRNTIPIAIPIVIRGQVLGVIEWEGVESELTRNRILLAEELASRLAISLDNARLVQTGRQTAENERIINTIGAKISGQTDINQILQTAIQEVGQALRAPQVNIRLHRLDNNGNGTRDNGHTPSEDQS